jgi:hypothetical protein
MVAAMIDLVRAVDGVGDGLAIVGVGVVFGPLAWWLGRCLFLLVAGFLAMLGIKIGAH